MNYFTLSKIFIIIPLLALVIVAPQTLFPFIVGKYAIFRAATDIALILLLVGLLQKNQESEKISKKIEELFKSPFFISLGIFTVVFILASVFGVNPANSFWSNFERGEGGIQIIHLFLFFSVLSVLFSNDKGWRQVLTFAVIGGLFVTGYGLFAALGKPGFIGARFAEPGFRFQGSIGNPAYVAAYMIFLMFYSACLLLIKNRKNTDLTGKIITAVCLVLFFVIFILAATRGAFLGLIAAVVAGVVYFAYNNPKLRPVLVSGLVILVLVVSVLVYFKNSPIIKSLPFARLFDISLSTETFRHRAIEWKVAIDAFKERPILGWGPENFIFAFDKHYNINHFSTKTGFGAWFDRAHNIFFDYLSTIGIVGLFAYLGIFLVFFWHIFKKHALAKENSHGLIIHAVLFAVIVAYLVQGMALFDVLTIYLNLFLTLAFANYWLYGRKSQNAND